VDCVPVGLVLELTSEAWEALNKTLKLIELAALSFPSDGLSWKLETEIGYKLWQPFFAHLRRRLR
jgi:hypothetical protein